MPALTIPKGTASATEQALIDAYGDPTGIISQSIGDMLMNPYGGMVDVRAGQEPSPTGQLTPWGGPLSVTLPGTHPIYSNVGINDARDLPLGFGELERQRNLVDILVAGGDLKAPSDYSAPVDVYGAGRLPGHYIDSDTYGYQAGLKAALAKQVNPLGETLYGLKQFLARQPENITDAQWELIKEAKSSAAEEARDAYDAAQDFRVNDESQASNVPFPLSLIPTADAAGGMIPDGGGGWIYSENAPQTSYSPKEVKDLLKSYNLQANTPSGIPGKPTEFRGLTEKDLPSKTQQAINAVMKAAPLVRSVVNKTPVGAALSGLVYSPDMGDSYVEDISTLEPYDFRDNRDLRGIFPYGDPESLLTENVRDEMAQRYEQAFVNPEQYDLAPFTLSQRRSALEDIKTDIEKPEGMWGRIGQRVRDRIADLIPEAEASIARDVEFERKPEPEPTWFPPTTSSGVVVVESPQQADTEPGDKYSGKVVLPQEPKKEPKQEPARESSKDREAREAREAASRVVKIHEDTAKRIKDEAKKSGDKTLQADDKKAIARANAAAERAKKKEDDLMKKQLDDMMKAAERQRNANRVLSTFVDPWAFEDRRGGRR